MVNRWLTVAYLTIALRDGPQISLYKVFHLYIMMSSIISLVPFKNVSTMLVFILVE